ncbi:MAG: hypothetical protein ACRC9P_01670 [Bacteroides sp.]
MTTYTKAIKAIDSSNGTTEQKAAVKIALKFIEERQATLKRLSSLNALEIKKELKQAVNLETPKGVFEVRGIEGKPHLTQKDKRLIRYIITESLYGRSVHTKSRPKHFYIMEQKARDLFTLRVKNWYDNSSLFAFITKKND